MCQRKALVHPAIKPLLDIPIGMAPLLDAQARQVSIELRQGSAIKRQLLIIDQYRKQLVVR